MHSLAVVWPSMAYPALQLMCFEFNNSQVYDTKYGQHISIPIRNHMTY